MNEVKTAKKVNVQTDTNYGFYTLVCGITLGCLLIISSIIFHFAGFDNSKIPEFVQYILMMGLLLYFQIKFRNEKLGGEISFKTSLRMGAMVVLYASALLSLYMFVFMKYVDDSVIKTILERVNKGIVNKELSTEQAYRSVSRLKKLVVPSIIATVFFFFIVALGMFFTLITSIFVKK